MNKRTVLALILVFAFLLTGCGTSKKSIPNSLIDMGAVSCDSMEIIKKEAKNYEAYSGTFIQPGHSLSAQELYDGILKNYNDSKDCEVSDGLFFVKSSSFEENNLNTYFVSITFKNMKDANAMYDSWLETFEGIGDGHKKYGVSGYKYTVYWHGNIKSVTGLALERGLGVYQSGKQVMVVTGIHPEDREDAVMKELCDRLKLVFPFEAL
ncbi:MAG: hypothetical protein J5777_07625 [Clostridiales bacterium]|nr:hypothetical protein [Clostridiales bacterium]